MQETHYLEDILILLTAAIIAVPLFLRLGLGSVLGYLAAGSIVGPWGLGFIDQIDEIRHIAEFGVIFLLFIIGIELKPARLWAMRRMVFGLGSAQVLVTGLVITGLALLFGQALNTAVVIGFGLALSSTAFGLQILTERGEMGSTYGQTGFSILLLQDLAVVPLLALVSLLATKTAQVDAQDFDIGTALLVLLATILVGRFLLTPLLRLVASCQTSEVFTAAAVLMVLGTAWLMEEVGLSLALGAFVAGLLLADSDYRHQIVADIEPFRGILLGLFFIGVGMSIDFGLLGREGPLIAALVAGLLLVKTLIIWGLCRLMGVTPADSTRVSLLLSQSGEFGFVLFGLATLNGLLSLELFQFLTLLIALTMVSTPLMAALGGHLHTRLSRHPKQHDISTDHLNAGHPHVIIAGFGRVGRRVAQLLHAGNVPYLAIDSNPDRVAEGRKDGFSVFYGDAGQVDLLKAAGAAEAGVLVCTLDQTVPAMRLVSGLRQHYPGMAIHARGRDRAHCEQLLKAGATVAISENLEASLQLGSAVLNTMGITTEDAATLVASFRKEYYG